MISHAHIFNFLDQHSEKKTKRYGATGSLTIPPYLFVSCSDHSGTLPGSQIFFSQPQHLCQTPVKSKAMPHFYRRPFYSFNGLLKGDPYRNDNTRTPVHLVSKTALSGDFHRNAEYFTEYPARHKKLLRGGGKDVFDRTTDFGIAGR